ncbi:hypothetical protein D3C87_517660 [compost metagenome]
MIIISPEISTQTTKTVFLAGGITNCPDWQTPTGAQLDELTNLVIFNPRRTEWNMDNSEEESRKQIIWEHEHLQRSETILFWFPKETLCPITLLELGKYLVSDKKLIVGTHPDYQRRLDVIVQSRLVRPDMRIWSNLEDMVFHFIGEYRMG